MRLSQKSTMLLVFFAMLAASVIITSCSGSKSSSGGSSGKAVTIRVPDVSADGPESRNIMEYLYSLFSKEHPNVTLDKVGGSEDNLDTMLAAGTAPDLVLADPNEIKAYYPQGYIAAIDDYYAKYGWGKDMFPWAKNAFVIKGKTYGIPWDYEGLMLYYNKKLFDKNNWKVPTNYNELLSLSQAMQAKNIIPFASGTSDCAGCNEWWITEIVNSALGPDGTKQLYSGNVSWTDPAVIEGLQRFVDYWNKGYISDKKNDSVSMTGGLNLFLTAKAAMMLDGTWDFSKTFDTTDDFELAFAKFPSWQPDGQPIVPLGVGGGLAINAKSDNKDVVAELLNGFFTDKARAIMAKDGVAEAVTTTYDTSDIPPVVVNGESIINDAVKSGKSGYVDWSYSSPSVVEELETDVAGIYLKKMSVSDWTKKLQQLKDKDQQDGTLFSLDSY